MMYNFYFNQIAMTVFVHTLWHIATLYICLLLLQYQVIFVRHFNDTVVWISTAPLPNFP